MRFGIHVPKQRDLTATAVYAAAIGCDTCQIFSGNPVGWAIGKLDSQDRDGFVRVTRNRGITPIFVHAPYLINIATPPKRLATLSRSALTDAIVRAHDLHCRYTVVHAGNHMGEGPDAGISRAIEAIDHVLADSPDDVTLLIEGGAGKGTEIGTSFAELARLVAPFPENRVGVLLDTAHLWALGYDLRSSGGTAALISDLDAGPGVRRLLGIHANDSLAERGSRRDRHALWTEGNMGRRAILNLIGTCELAHLPLIFEVPGDSAEFDRKRLALMRRRDRRARSRQA